MKTAAAYKSMAKKYNAMTDGEQRAINRGLIASQALGFAVAGGIGVGAANSIYLNKRFK